MQALFSYRYILFFYCRGLLHRSDVSEGWSMPFMGSDRSVVLRTQRFLYEKYKQRPVQIQTYVTFQLVYQ